MLEAYESYADVLVNYRKTKFMQQLYADIKQLVGKVKHILLAELDKADHDAAMPILRYLIILLQAQYLKEQGTETLYCQGLKAYKDKFVQLKLSTVAGLAKTAAIDFLATSFTQYEKMFMSHKVKI